MDTLWSMSTTIREAERIEGFLKTATELEGKEWNQLTQMEFQIRLIKNRQYLNNSDNAQTFNKLNEKQCDILRDKSKKMTFEEAKEIFEAKKYEDPPMRGRQSMSPLVKLGLVYIINEKVTISDVGRKLAENKIEFDEFMMDSLLKFQYPNPYEGGFRDWNTKPFINTLRLIKRVNERCNDLGMKEKGISKHEFGIFALSLKSYKDVNMVAEKVIKFREEYESLREIERDDYVRNYTKDYLENFKNPESNTSEYTDNMIRYMRLTKYIYIRGRYNYTYIDLEPRRMTEINSILETDDGHALEFTEEQWRNYMGVYGTYKLPFETEEKLKKILREITSEIKELEKELNIESSSISIEDEHNMDNIKLRIKEYRAYRRELQNQKIKKEYHENTNKIEEAIQALIDIRDRNRANLAKKYSIELEKWSNIALNIINDSLLIKPNAPVGDDNEPTYTAPSGVADIECYYKDFSSICEVTMLCNRDQWYNEGQPVMRHLRDFESSNTELPNYCLFIAPSLHQDTINTFFNSVKFQYEGKKQKIIPITINQLIYILETIKILQEKGKTLKHKSVMKLYEACSDDERIENSIMWREYIEQQLELWRKELLA